ncbi:hypothetical protein [uncultured Photobacterium sp.]|uniref:hypothetical protein n=1 Tax=uncultured Photobacterium sp. TaxID=173973 RepID=UPI002604C9FC|nr:hypothetical protein [uncultured Photobacterium sp.]
MTQKEIIEVLTKEEQDVLQAVLNLEQTKLNIVDLKANSSEEKTLVQDIYFIIEGKITQ